MRINIRKVLWLVLLVFHAGGGSLYAQHQATDYQVVADDAAWCWFSDPRAVYHAGVHERIYYGYITSRGDVAIGSKDLNTEEIISFVLHQELQVDDHNVPSILVLPDGHILAFYTEHNGRFFICKSRHPEDISAWEAERIIPFGGSKITYSHPVMLAEEGNRIYVFWRGSDWRPAFAFSDDLGDTWSETKVLIDSKGTKNRPYLKVSSDGQNRIDFAFTDGHPAIEPTNSIYHTYYENGEFYQTDGRHIASITGLPLSHSDVQKVYDGADSGIRSWVADVASGKDGLPVIAYTRYPEDIDHRYHYARWDGKRWQDEEICKAGGRMPEVKIGEDVREPHYSGGIAIDHSNPENVYLSREINGRFEIEHWKKEKKRWQVNRLTVQSDVNNMRPYVITLPMDRSPIVLWMTGRYNHYTRFNTMLRINELAEKKDELEN
ncbi:BNR repeat-containing protein [Parapedobacter tibetensis]|uniref:BNR repeat-containing protein n=1 Tax=Parapedobacter tibetensis TaxID=2972951 RepID=UPI00214D4518|nr:BNR repeat-containing protein [Parapedobacter tibetensis]